MADLVFGQPLVAGQSIEARMTLRLTGIATAAPSGTQNNYAPTGAAAAAILLLAPTAALTVTGLSIGQLNGRFLLLANTSTTEYITLVNGSLSSTSTNRFALAENYVVPPGTGVLLVYLTSDNRWHLFADKPSHIARIYTSNDTWNPPPGLVAVTAMCIGGGGGGGAGCCGATNTLRRGGFGAAGGGVSQMTFPSTAMSGTKIIQVGDGGTGGIGSSSAGAGQDGQDGDESEFDVLLRAGGGARGMGGTALGLGTSPSAGGLGTVSDGQLGAVPSTTGLAGATPPSPPRLGGGGGASGGGLTTGNAASAGGVGGVGADLSVASSGGSAGSSGGGNGGNGASGASSDMPGGGGGGGGSRVSGGPAGNGGDGGQYGGGGGGGGASITGQIAGDGGNGANGLVVIIEHY